MLKNEIKEVEITFWRLAKIFWSQAWRIGLLFTIMVFLLMPFMMFGAHFFGTDMNAQDQIPQFQGIITNYALLRYGIAYLILFMLFWLTIGIKYKDFTLSFVPKVDRKTPGYWTAIRDVSWSYYWRCIPLYIMEDLFKYIFPPHTFGFINLVVNGLSIILYIFILRFVVNKQYGNFRLSLLA